MYKIKKISCFFLRVAHFAKKREKSKHVDFSFRVCHFLRFAIFLIVVNCTENNFVVNFLRLEINVFFYHRVKSQDIKFAAFKVFQYKLQ